MSNVNELMAEIHAEADRLRSSGAVPPGLEAELDEIFAHLAPVGAVTEDFGSVLDKVERVAFVDTAAPTASNLPAGRMAKQGMRRLVGWQLDHLARQVTGFHHAVIGALRRLDERLSRVERVAPVSGLTGASLRFSADNARLRRWARDVSDLLAGSTGRVLHAECGDGWLVQALSDVGCDVYGVDGDRASVPISSELELRVDDPLDHLGVLPDGSLGGLVVSGIVDRFPAPAQTAMVSLARSRLAPGARLVVLGTDPRTWRAGIEPVAADLSPGRPLYPETWTHLLSVHGFLDVAVRLGDVADVVGDGFDDPSRRLAEMVVGRGSYLVVGTRPR